MSESFSEQLSRLSQMADDDGETWDLSENDRAAIRSILMAFDVATNEPREANSVSAGPPPEPVQAIFADAEPGSRSGVFVMVDGVLTEHAHPHAGYWLDVLSHLPTNECPDMECCVCAVRDCPHQEPLHYHHDGCPACWQSGVPNAQPEPVQPQTEPEKVMYEKQKWECANCHRSGAVLLHQDDGPAQRRARFEMSHEAANRWKKPKCLEFIDASQSAPVQPQTEQRRELEGEAELVLAWATQTRFGDRGLRMEVERAARVIRQLLALNTQPDPVQALIAQWRKAAERGDITAADAVKAGLKLTGVMTSGMATALRECANELEALVSAPSRPEK